MGKLLVSNVPDGACQSRSSAHVFNTYWLGSPLQMGDLKASPGPDRRTGLIFNFDIAGVPKTAIVTDVKITVSPTTTQTKSDENAQHRFGLITPNGQWNRSPQNTLHKSNSGIVFGAPSHNLTTWMEGFNSLAEQVFFLAGGQLVSFTTRIEWPTLGSTFLLPADKELDSIDMFIKTLDASNSKEVRILVYELTEDVRYSAVSALIATSDAVLYSALPTSVHAKQNFPFASGAIASAGFPRWFGAILGGEIFDDDSIMTTSRISFRCIRNNDDTIYGTSSFGSAFTANRAREHDNAFIDAGYIYSMDMAHIYRDNSLVPLTTPYNRIWGNILSSADASVTWTDGVDYNYGSPASGQLNEFPGIVAEIQAWIDSSYYNPTTGNTFLAFSLEVFDPDNVVWENSGIRPTGQTPCKLEITFKDPIDFVSTSLAMEPNFTAESLGTEASFTAQSLATENSITLEAMAIEPSFVAESKSTEPSFTGFRE